MGNQLCSYCIALQDENFTSASRLREIKQFAEMEKRRQEEEETKKQLLRALIYEDILRRVNKENEIEAARKAAIDARKNKIEAENLNAINKAEAEIYRIQAEQNAVRAMLASMEEQKDERQKPAPPAPAPAPIVVVKAEKVEVKAEKVEVKTDPKVLTSLIIAPAQSDVETEQDIEKETTTVEENETVAFLMDITFNQSSQQSAGIKILPYKLAYLTVTGNHSSF